MVALMQTATSLPFFLLALPAGALADIMNRRRLLLLMQGWMVAVAAVLGVLTLGGVVTPWLLLAFTFALGLGAAMNAPAWQAITPELVSREELPAAVALSSVGINLAHAIGPALDGLIVAAAGSAAVFLLNATSFVGVMLALYRWRRTPRRQALPPEHVLGGMRAGLRYVRHAPAIQAVLVRCGLFILCGAALRALLPLVARREMGLDAIGYGGLLASLGVGAIGGAAILPRVRRRLTVDRLVVGATVLFAGVTGILAFLREFWWLCVAILAGGVAWMARCVGISSAMPRIQAATLKCFSSNPGLSTCAIMNA
jgi:MFS family permease